MSFALFPLSHWHCSSMKLSPLLNYLYIMEQHPSLQYAASRRAFANMTSTAPHLNNITCPSVVRNGGYNYPEYVGTSPIPSVPAAPRPHHRSLPHRLHPAIQRAAAASSSFSISPSHASASLNDPSLVDHAPELPAKTDCSKEQSLPNAEKHISFNFSDDPLSNTNSTDKLKIAREDPLRVFPFFAPRFHPCPDTVYNSFGNGLVREAYDGEPITRVLANAMNYPRILFPRHPDDRTPLPQEPQGANGPTIHVHGTINVFESLHSQHSEGSPAVQINNQAVHGMLPSMAAFPPRGPMYPDNLRPASPRALTIASQGISTSIDDQNLEDRRRAISEELVASHRLEEESPQSRNDENRRPATKKRRHSGSAAANGSSAERNRITIRQFTSRIPLTSRILERDRRYRAAENRRRRSQYSQRQRRLGQSSSESFGPKTPPQEPNPVTLPTWNWDALRPSS